MLRSLNFLLLLLLLNGTTFARQPLSGQLSKHPTMAILNISTTSHLMQGSSNPLVTSPANGTHNSSHSAVNLTPPMPTLDNPKSAINAQDILSGSCAIGDDFCSFKESNGTIIKATATNFSDQCLLWDHSCTGNRTLAIQKFFDIAFADAELNGDDLNGNGRLMDNDCFLQNSVVNQSDCNRYNSPQRLSDFEKIKKWMRSQECVAAADEYMAMTGNSWQIIFGHPTPDLGLIAESSDSIDDPASNSPSCCGTCNVIAQNVDLYYWLEPTANLSCLDIIGKRSDLPLDYGATTAIDDHFTQIYWGCNATSTGTIEGESEVTTTRSYILTTAQITTIGSLSVKVSSISPWSSSPCLGGDTGSQPSNHSINGRDKGPSIYAREHSLFVPPSITQADGLPVSTLVSGDFTFTSPSVYAYFQALSIDDNCGESIMSPTMLSFSQGELSTIDGHLGYLQTDPFGTGQSSKQFDLGDLPCPPQSVMEANWYKPQPGEPYRPLIAMPSQLKHINPLFSFCNGGLFTAYDPPRALNSEAALIPPELPSDPKPHAPVPSPTIDPGFRQKGGPEASIVVPANIATLDQPKATTNTASNPQQGSDLKQGNDPNRASDPKQASGNDEQSGQGADPGPNNDPNKASDPKQASGNDEQSGQEADPAPNNDPIQVSPVPQNDPKQTDNVNLFNDFSQGQIKTINNQVVQPLSHGISIAGTTLTPGAPPITVSGTPIHLDSSALIIGTTTVPLSGDTDPVTLTIAGHSIKALPDAIVVAGTTLTKGAPPLTVSGTPIFLGPSAIVVGSSTVPIPSKSIPQMITTVAGQVITAAPNIVTIAGTTLTPGGPGITLDGTLLSLEKASQVIIGPKTISLQSASPDPIITTIGGQVITATPDKISIGGTTLTPGAPEVTVAGTLVSLNTAGQLVIGPKTVALQSGSGSGGGSGELIPGESVTGAQPSDVNVADAFTTTLDDGQVITAGPAGLVAMAGTTLTPGAPGITINGTLVSLKTDSQLVLGSKTVSLGSEDAGSSARQTVGLGSLIMGGLAGLGPPPVDGGGDRTPSSQSNGSMAAVGNGTGEAGDGQVFTGAAAGFKGISLGRGNNVIGLLSVVGMVALLLVFS